METIQIKYKEGPSCDVLVCGGGVAGVAAAITAARAGAKTILIEKSTFLGGMATGALVTPMMKNAFTKGIFLEICDRLVKAGGGAVFKDGNPGWFNPEIYKIVLDEMCTEAGVEIFFDTQLVHANVNESEDNYPRLRNVVVFNKNGFSSINAKEFIDTTGDGDLMHLSGVSYESKEKQAMSLRFMMGGINVNELGKWLETNDKSGDSPVYYLDSGDILLSTAFTFERDWALKSFFEKALKNNDLTKEDAEYFQIFSVPGAHDMIAFNCPRIKNNDDISGALITGRQMIKRISNFCRKYLPGFKSAYISQIAPNLGVRVTRRLVGQYRLTKDDVLSGKKFDDAIADSNWPIDIHPNLEVRNQKSEVRNPPKNDYYQIPLRSLLPKENEIKNLIVAGRCLSADFEAQSSARIQANCIAMGEAAGNLAAKRVKQISLHLTEKQDQIN